MQHEQDVLRLLEQQQRIIRVDQMQKKQRISEEIQNFTRLQEKVSGYLNLYDQLFRLITIWLLERGYDLTNYQPHQVLKGVCLLHCSDCDLERVIQLRHQLKKGMLFSVYSDCAEDLQHCHHYFVTNLQAYICISTLDIHAQ